MQASRSWNGMLRMLPSFLRRHVGKILSDRALGSLISGEAGTTTTVLALGAPVLLLCAGAAIDFSRSMNQQNALQAAADAAALGAVQELGTLPDTAITKNVATLFNANLRYALPRPATLNTVVDAKGNSLTVTAVAPFKTSFLALAGLTTFDIHVLSKARNRTYKPCVIALDPVASGAMSVSGNGSISVPKCAVYVNSSSPTALSQTGSSGSITAKSISIVGNYSKSSIVSPAPSINQPVYADPLAALPEPRITGSCTYTNMTVASSQSFPAGSIYCGNISFTGGTVTLQPGIHYFRSATVTVSSNTTIVGNGVMLYFDGNSYISKSSGGGQFVLSAMTSGPYKGIAMFGSRTSTKMQVFTLTGNKDYYVSGTIYLPKAKLSLFGTTDLAVSSKSGFVISQQFSYQGDSSFTMTTAGDPIPDLLRTGSVSLVQ